MFRSLVRLVLAAAVITLCGVAVAQMLPGGGGIMDPITGGSMLQSGPNVPGRGIMVAPPSGSVGNFRVDNLANIRVTNTGDTRIVAP
jgi:hypothetical protein